ncbi:methyl-accepting chemotaxis protein [uncultured Ramlibacter sp.]|uniref:methyl-accepting chemotaxis protein n=1 Tax=uncultured Ramlibacter sp. TaxID=260755 RepID=UPI00262BC9F2|nr:methyl-accepting chemotaxis protein [uncultured Ramlibacter sp.]
MKPGGLKLWGRLALAFGALLLLQIVMAVAAVYELRQIDQIKHRQEAMAESRHLAFQWNAQTRMNVIRAVMLAKAGSPADLATWANAEMKQTSAKISELQTALEKGLEGDKAHALMARVADTRKTYVGLRASLLERMAKLDDTAAAAAEIDSKLIPSVNAYLASLDDVVAHMDDALKAQSAAMTQAINFAQTLLPVLSTIAVLLGALLAWAVARSLVRPIRQVIVTASNIAAGDLSNDLAVTRRDELGELQAALADMQARLREMVSGIRAGTDSVSVATGQIASGNQDLSARTEQAASNLQQTAATMALLTDTVRQSATSATSANQLADTAAAVARRGGEVVSQVVATMADINEGSNRIADIIGVIDSIAFQTNILALNAAVEAARAGEQGRGFAVVASEVRSLAGRSAEAAREIKTLIGASVEKVGNGSRLVRDAGQTMQEIEGSVQRVTAAIGEITAAAAGQAGSIGEVNQAVGHLDQITQQNAALVEEAAAAAQSLKDQAASLARMVMSFRLVPGAVAAS